MMTDLLCVNGCLGRGAVGGDGGGGGGGVQNPTIAVFVYHGESLCRRCFERAKANPPTPPKAAPC